MRSQCVHRQNDKVGYVSGCMPLGDPCGGEFDYTDEGLPETLSAVSVRCRDVEASEDFYCSLLGFRPAEEEKGLKVLKRGDATLILTGGFTEPYDTGIYFGVENPYDLHRRLIDEGVVFVRDPLNSPIGVYTSFRDPSGNTVHAADRRGRL